MRKQLPGKPHLDTILGLFPRTTSEPAFDPGEIASKAKNLRTTPEINTGHPFLDLSVRTGLAHIDATFNGDCPKYGQLLYTACLLDERAGTNGWWQDGFQPLDRMAEFLLAAR